MTMGFNFHAIKKSQNSHQTISVTSLQLIPPPRMLSRSTQDLVMQGARENFSSWHKHKMVKMQNKGEGLFEIVGELMLCRIYWSQSNSYNTK